MEHCRQIISRAKKKIKTPQGEIKTLQVRLKDSAVSVDNHENKGELAQQSANKCNEVRIGS